MNKGSTGTSLHSHIAGKYVKAEGGKCAGCNSRTFVWQGHSLRIIDGKSYCQGCFLQVKRGVKVEYQPPIYKICKNCGIGKLYGNRCFTCYPNIVLSSEIANERQRAIREDNVIVSSFNDKGLLKKGLSFCQYIKCRKQYLTKDAVRIARGIGNRLSFCSGDCMNLFERENNELIFKMI